ncbi:LysR family transcriptional regulator [Kaistia algarum]|uniref:LysR family transcriptional regulator n=1 Tax=Kaistia algarum TaxID=2083279 RepID=UPI000CE90CDA|nr:LysR family transcriptional regulator [Kaistia algarum]MCX5515763.1 LysR family transcriptional regulator [Kaistia algarum]PPE80862.1 LysR family transcriptional regulator [Kaistia algarum]
MIDGFSLDQLRTFVAAADSGSFSAAGRQLGRAQSVVSQTIANLESLIGVTLFDRSARYPVLTKQGRALLEQARAVTSAMDQFKARARGLSDGLEPELSVVINVLFPTRVLTAAVAGFQMRFPDTPLRISVEGLGAVLELVLDGTCAFGIRGPIGGAHPDLSSEYLLQVGYQMVAAPSHPLAHCRGPIPTKTLGQYVQLVLSDRSKLTEDKDFRVFAPKTWRLYDLGAKHALLKAGLGWGGMPVEIIREDLDRGLLVPLEIADMTIATTITMSAIYRADAPPGPAGRGLIEELVKASSKV